ncbi:MAG: hypothetical protein J6R29_05170, partial [Clostridia bacterium]|nr:hypothetical protein [Clostridia bacterium]
PRLFTSKPLVVSLISGLGLVPIDIITTSTGISNSLFSTAIGRLLPSLSGSPYILDGINENGEISLVAREQVENLLKQSFRPEFLNRLDEIVFYKPLTKGEISKIVNLLIKSLKNRLKDKELYLEITKPAIDYIIENGYDATYGARPLKRFIQSRVETLVAKHIIKSDLKPNSVLVVDCIGGELFISVK